MERIAASDRTRERLKALVGGTSGSGSGSSDLVRLAARLIIEEALEGEAADALGRGYYARGAAPEAGYRNGYQIAARSIAAGPSIMPFRCRLQRPGVGLRSQPWIGDTMLRFILSLLLAVSFAVAAHAQSTLQQFGNGYILNTPGQPPTTIQPFGNGYIVNTPGRMPSAIQPFGSGYISNTPGQMPITSQPFGNGYIVNSPGSMPTTVQPFGNGYITNTPGQMPTTMQPFGNGYIINDPN